MNKLIIIVLFFFVSCLPGSIPSANKVIAIIEKGTDSTYKREYFPNPNKSLYVVLAKYFNAPVETFFYYHDIDKKTVSEIKTFMIKSLYGHYFEFYDNGKLRQYCYYVGSGNNTSYLKQYSKDGTLENEKGNPFVDYTRNDKKELELHFSTVFFDSLSVELSSKNIQFQKIHLNPSSMLPMLSESVIPITDSIFYLKIIGYGKKETKIYSDTLNITQLWRSLF
jgi:hypothetical protein